MAIYTISHITKYTYEKSVIESVNEIRIFPFICQEQELINQELNISFSPILHTYTDYWKNKVATFSILHPHRELVIESHLTVRTTASSLIQVNFHSDFSQLYQETSNNLYLTELTKPEKIKNQGLIRDIVTSLSTGSASVAETIEKCSSYIFKHFKYVQGITDIETTVDEILQHKAGVCQDFAHLMLQILRTLKIPSRYVSGYICPNKSGMRGEGATHAWIEAFIPQFGWAGIDPTNNTWVTNYHVKLAIGRNFKDCTPVKGTFRGNCHQLLSVHVSIHYEDGKLFEQTNAVKRRDSALAPEPLGTHLMGNQQQQQQ
ncbi:transglutaminase family protein [Olivibacter sp. XZL3]|uniref:transglutaminase family protein n=1 Tax=Olivibacter sp. XZL3 TaxID=1735116 RepID=UPI001066A7B6|nr:transglutaminase family protein [Olivibacter sp. XZL3]